MYSIYSVLYKHLINKNYSFCDKTNHQAKTKNQQKKGKKIKSNLKHKYLISICAFTTQLKEK